MADEKEKTADLENTEIEVIETPDGQPPAEDAEPREKLSINQPDDDDDDEDERLGSSDEDTSAHTNADKRKERRERRRKSLQAKDALLDRMREENEMMKQRLAAIENNVLQVNYSTTEQQLQNARATRAQATAIMEKASEAGNTMDVVEAMRIRDAAEAEIARLEPEVMRMGAVRNAPQPQMPQAPQPPAAALEFQRAWREANSWYSDNPQDQNSNIARQISAQLVSEGIMPASLEHWRELSGRLNDMAAEADAAPQRKSGRRGPPVDAQRSGNGSSANASNRVYLSPERVAAIKESGNWDDIPKRNAMIRAYQQWDRENAGRQ